MAQAPAATLRQQPNVAAHSSTSHHLQPLLLLCTGTLVVIANQVVSNQAAVSPKAQLLTLMRYLCTFGLSAILILREKRLSSKAGAASAKAPALTATQRRRILLLLLAVGFLDVGCYSLYNIGFAMCGSALATIVLAATGQIATAVLSVVILKRQLRTRHIAAVTIVTVGLVLRSMDDILAGTLRSSSSSSSADAQGSSKQTYGALCVMLSALLFSILGIVYEMRSASNQDRKVSQSQVGRCGCVWRDRGAHSVDGCVCWLVLRLHGHVAAGRV